MIGFNNILDKNGLLLQCQRTRIIMNKNNWTLEMSKEEMRAYAYSVADAVVTHFDTQNEKLPVALGSREEMDHLFLEEAPKSQPMPKRC